MPLPGNGVLGVDETASLWNIVGADWFLPCVHLCSLQLLVSDETGKANTLTQGGCVMSIYQVPGEAIVPGVPRKLWGFTTTLKNLAATFGDSQKIPRHVHAISYIKFILPYERGTYTHGCR